jgi:hypothetical protein
MNKNNDKIEKLKKMILNEGNKNSNKYTESKDNFNELYQEIISHYIKYEIYKKNTDDKNKNQNQIQTISTLEKIIFRQISILNNNKTNNKINEKDILKKINKFNTTGDTKLLKDLYQENNTNKFSKKYLLNEKKQKKEVTYPYPRLLFLSDKELSSIIISDKLSMGDISKYYNIIHPGQVLELKGITMNKNIISGIQIYDENKKDYELFKLCNPINIPSQNKINNNTLYYLNTLYKNIIS